MKMLDLYCKAGGAGMGYHRAGWEVVGVDIEPQPRYPFRFVRADALEYLREHWREFDAIHASPPCQRYSAMTKGRWQDRVDEHPDLIEPTRRLLKETGLPYIIENVIGAPLINPVRLCGSMFGLQSSAGNPLYRHRIFETNFLIGLTPPCSHNKVSALPAVAVYGHSGGTSKRGDATFGIQARREAMGIDWMTGNELSQAIPPAYTEFIGGFIR